MPPGEQPQQADQPLPPAIIEQLAPKADLKQAYEDIEIYRRLLLKALLSHVNVSQASHPNGGRAYPVVGNNPYKVAVTNYYSNLTDPHAGIGASSFSVEGALLSPGGIVLAAELPMNLPVPEKNVRTEAKKLTEWERARRELHGEKLDKSEKPLPPRRPYILDTVLHTLAENGHHLSGLAPTENVTTVLTFRGGSMQQCQSCHGVASNQASGNAGTSNYYGLRRLFTNTPSSYSNADSAHGNGQSPRTSSYSNQETVGAPAGQQGQSGALAEKLAEIYAYPGNDGSNNRVLVGDLHFKQGRFEDALAAYAKAKEEYAKAFPSKGNWYLDPKGREVIMMILELQNKMIQCHMALKQEDKVEQGVQSLKNYMTLLERFDGQGEAAKPGNKTTSTAKVAVLPTKVIISASKALLDQVGKGEISFEDFRKKASVDILRFESAGLTREQTGEKP